MACPLVVARRVSDTERVLDFVEHGECIFSGGSQIKCFPPAGELNNAGCTFIKCVPNPGAPDEPTAADYQCPAQQTYWPESSTVYREVTSTGPALRVGPCFDRTKSPEEFCGCDYESDEGGATQIKSENEFCWYIEECRTEPGTCLKSSADGEWYCTVSLDKGPTDPQPHERPDTDFPCPTQTMIDELLDWCQKIHGG